MELDGIAVFVKVVQSGSFTQAGKLLDMPKTTVSAKVAALENRLGVTLIQRTTRKLHVTEAGAAFFKHCLRALEEVEAGERELASGQDEPRGVLKLTAPADLGQSLLPPLVREYLKRHPNVQVELLVTNRMVDLVGEGVDIGIRAGALKDSSLKARKFISVEMSLWASPAYLRKHGVPSQPKELARHDAILSKGFKDRPFELTDGKTTASIDLGGRVVADDFQVIKSLTQLGLGIGLMPDFLCEPREKEVGDAKLVRVLPRWHHSASSHFSFVYPEQRFVSSKVRAFIDLACEVHGSRIDAERA